MDTEVSDWLVTSSGDPRGYIQPHTLNELWFHTGTACNLACPFCLEGSSPGDNRLERITLADVSHSCMKPWNLESNNFRLPAENRLS